MRKKDYSFHTGLSQRLWISFKNLETDSNLESYVKYYKALSTWAIANKDSIGDRIFDEFRLSILIKLDPQKYVREDMESSGISLEMEHKRMFGREKPKYLETLAQRIGTTLWDLVTEYSGIDCPCCIYDDGLRYVMIEKDSNKCELALCCESCGRLQALNGRIIPSEGLKIKPANREDIEKYSALIPPTVPK